MPWMPSAAIARNRPDDRAEDAADEGSALLLDGERAIRMTTVSGTTAGARDGASTLRNSRALGAGDQRRDGAVAVEQGGAGPTTRSRGRAQVPGSALHARRAVGPARRRCRLAPWLSARRISRAYFIEMIRISAHRMATLCPSTASGVTVPPWVAARAASLNASRAGWCRCRHRRHRGRRAWPDGAGKTRGVSACPPE